jgi:hypothetical protein
MTNAVNIAQSGSNNVTFRNRIINGAMVIDQRNAGASVTISSTGYTYCVDRFSIYASIGSKLTAQQNQNSVTPPAGFTNYFGVTSSAATSLGATDLYSILQVIEGLNIYDLGWGTANAKTITISFWVRSSLTGTFGGALNNSSYARSYPFSYSISSANTWEQKTITIAGDTSGTWLTTNGVGVRVWFSLGAGATLSGTAGAWAATEYESVTGATSVVGTNGATFYITGVQLEAGTTASPFEYRQYGTEFSLCQRYFYKVAGGTSYQRFGIGASNATTTQYPVIPLQTYMRVGPTSLTTTGSFGVWTGATVFVVSSLVLDSVSPNTATLSATTSGITANVIYQLIANNDATATLGFSAEL